MSAKRGILLYVIMLILLINASATAGDMVYSTSTNYSNSILDCYGDFEITSSGEFIFSKDITITVDGNAEIYGTLKSWRRSYSNASSGSGGDDGRTGSESNWPGGNGAGGTDGSTGHDGSDGRDLALNVKGTLTLSGVIASKGGSGGDGGNGGSGGDGGDGWTGRKDKSGPVEMESIHFGLMATNVNPDGGDGGKGGKGGNGGSGGNGGNIIIRASKIVLNSSANLESNNGSRGSKGNGGVSGAGGDGGRVRVYIDDELLDTYSGSDGSRSGSQGSGSYGKIGAVGSIKLITPNLSVANEDILENVHIITDEFPPQIVECELMDFEDAVQSGLNPKLKLVVKDTGGEIGKENISPSGVDIVELTIKDTSGSVVGTYLEEVEYSANEDLGVEKEVTFALNNLSSGNYTLSVLVSHKNKYSNQEVSKELSISMDNKPPTAPSSINFRNYKTDGSNLKITWNAFSDINGVKYNYRLYRGSALLKSGNGISVRNITYSPYPYDKSLKFVLQAVDFLGNRTGDYIYNFTTLPANPEIISFDAMGNQKDGYKGYLTLKEVKASDYQIKWRSLDSTDWKPYDGDIGEANGNLICIINGLEAHKSYEVEVYSKNCSDRLSLIADYKTSTVVNNSPIVSEEYEISPLGYINEIEEVRFYVEKFNDPDSDQLKYYLTVEELRENGYVEIYKDLLMNSEGEKYYREVDLKSGKEYRWKVKLQDIWTGDLGEMIELPYRDLETDTTPPEFINVTYSEFTNENKITISGIDYSSDVEKLIIKYGEFEDDLLGLSSYQLILNNLDGVHSVSIIAYDRAENFKQIDCSIVLDRVVPNIPEIQKDSFIIEEDLIEVVWAEGNDDASGIAYYELAWQRVGDSGWTYVNPITNNHFLVNTLDANEQITVKVKAFDGANNDSEYCNPCTVSTLPKFLECTSSYSYEIISGSYQHYVEFSVDAKAQRYKINKLDSNISGNWKNVDESTRINITSHEDYTVEIVVENADGLTQNYYYSETVPNNLPTITCISFIPDYINSSNPILINQGAYDVDNGDILTYTYSFADENDNVINMGEFKEGARYSYQVAVSDGYDEVISDWDDFVIDLTEPTIAVVESKDYSDEWTDDLDVSIYAEEDAQIEADKNSGVDGISYKWNDTSDKWEWGNDASAENISVTHGVNVLYIRGRDNVGNTNT
ncbi:MAG: fibronectin type III domain-containing protein, partial [Halanaerobiales bacterium]|nr:fibronectin type III domain-containing protein [Halanaerobiales bacterium]